jgi:hypothetical protein
MWATAARSAWDQFRTQAISPLSLLAALATPLVLAFVVQSYAGGRATPAIAVGVAGVGMVSAIIVDQLGALMSERRWRTLPVALGSPTGMVPVVLGRLAGVAAQSLVSLPGTLLMLAVLWGLSSPFDWLTWAVGGVCLAATMSAVVGLLAYFLLRYPLSPGMTNGLAGILIALGTLLAPSSALPEPLVVLSWLLPPSHVMAWVTGAGAFHLAIAGAEIAIAYTIIYASMRRVERLARRDPALLEL